LSTLETIVADFGVNLSPKTATVAKWPVHTGDYWRLYSPPIRRLSPKSATVAGFGNSRRIGGL